MVDVVFADVAQPDQARILALNCHHFLKNQGHFVISIKVGYEEVEGVEGLQNRLCVSHNTRTQQLVQPERILCGNLVLWYQLRMFNSQWTSGCRTRDALQMHTSHTHTSHAHTSHTHARTHTHLTLTLSPAGQLH